MIHVDHQTDVEQYQRDGYLVAPSVLMAAELEQMRAEAERLLTLCAQESERYAARIQWEVDYLADAARAGMDRVIRKLEPVSDLSPLFADLASHPALTGPISAIFAQPIELFEDKLNLKLPGGSPYPWHQDWVCCWRAHTDHLVTCFIYLDDADATNGCLQVIPGTHRDKQHYPFAPGSRFEIDPASVPHEQATPVPLRAGDMIYFDPYLLHFSDLNRSAVPRRAIIYTYNPAGLGKINEGRFPHDHT